MLVAMLEAVGLAVACVACAQSVAFALDTAALLALVPLRVRLAFKPTLAWRYVALIFAMAVPAQPMPAKDRALRGDMFTTAVAKDAAVRGTTYLSLANVRLSHALSLTLRTFGSELHGQWRAEEGIAPPPSALASGLSSTCNSPSTHPAPHGSCTRLDI
jgi:hypothetical protein